MSDKIYLQGIDAQVYQLLFTLLHDQPSIRDCARYLGVSKSEAEYAFKRLKKQGVISGTKRIHAQKTQYEVLPPEQVECDAPLQEPVCLNWRARFYRRRKKPTRPPGLRGCTAAVYISVRFLSKKNYCTAARVADYLNIPVKAARLILLKLTNRGYLHRERVTNPITGRKRYAYWINKGPKPLYDRGWYERRRSRLENLPQEVKEQARKMKKESLELRRRRRQRVVQDPSPSRGSSVAGTSPAPSSGECPALSGHRPAQVLAARRRKLRYEAFPHRPKRQYQPIPLPKERTAYGIGLPRAAVDISSPYMCRVQNMLFHIATDMPLRLALAEREEEYARWQWNPLFSLVSQSRQQPKKTYYTVLTNTYLKSSLGVNYSRVGAHRDVGNNRTEKTVLEHTSDRALSGTDVPVCLEGLVSTCRRGLGGAPGGATAGPHRSVGRQPLPLAEARFMAKWVLDDDGSLPDWGCPFADLLMYQRVRYLPRHCYLRLGAAGACHCRAFGGKCRHVYRMVKYILAARRTLVRRSAKWAPEEDWQDRVPYYAGHSASVRTLIHYWAEKAATKDLGPWTISAAVEHLCELADCDDYDDTFWELREWVDSVGDAAIFSEGYLWKTSPGGTK